MPTLSFECVSRDGAEQRTFDAKDLVLAGWTGRDATAVQHHIAELAEHGVAPPSRTPIFYRCAAQLVTQTPKLQVLGPDTSGEVEYVLLAFNDGIWVTVGSDQTDRKAEAMGVALSKQLAAKVLASTCWPLAELSPHWDEITIQSWATIAGGRVLYQDSTLGAIRSPEDLIETFAGQAGLAPGTVMMSGTLSAIGGIRPASRFDMELADPNLNRVIRHGYDIEVLEVVS